MPPMPLGESTTEMIERLTQAVRAHNGAAPFTLQRMAELLLEPQKQYARLDKLVQPLTLQRFPPISDNSCVVDCHSQTLHSWEILAEECPMHAVDSGAGSREAADGDEHSGAGSSPTAPPGAGFASARQRKPKAACWLR